NRLTAAHAGTEAPLRCGVDCFLVKAERWIEGSHHHNVGAHANGLHNALNRDGTLRACAHRVGGVPRGSLPNLDRHRHVPARTIRAVADALFESVTNTVAAPRTVA